jgi:hypothetical protein
MYVRIYIYTYRFTGHTQQVSIYSWQGLDIFVGLTRIVMEILCVKCRLHLDDFVCILTRFNGCVYGYILSAHYYYYMFSDHMIHMERDKI